MCLQLTNGSAYGRKNVTLQVSSGTTKSIATGHVALAPPTVHSGGQRVGSLLLRLTHILLFGYHVALLYVDDFMFLFRRKWA